VVGQGLGLNPARGCCYSGPAPWCGRGGALCGFEDSVFDFADFSFDAVYIVPHGAEAFQDGYDVSEVMHDLVFSVLRYRGFGVCELVLVSIDQIDGGLEGGLE